MWYKFSENHPMVGDLVTIYWSDGTVDDSRWALGIDWDEEIIPVFWKLMENK